MIPQTTRSIESSDCNNDRQAVSPDLARSHENGSAVPSRKLRARPQRQADFARNRNGDHIMSPMTIHRAALAILAAAIAGCQTTPGGQSADPERRTITVDGSSISVVPRSPGQYDAFGGDDGSDNTTSALKARHIRAVEMLTRCKVSTAEYIPSTSILQTQVTCK